MTGKEIIEVLKSHLSVENFADMGNSYSDSYYPEDFKISEVAKKRGEEKDAALIAVKEHPDYNKNPRPQYIQDLWDKWSSIPYQKVITQQEWLDSIGVGSMKEITQKGGEGKGDEWYSVKYFPLHDVYLRVDGWYQSYSGTDFEDWDSAVKEVKPQQKTITVFS